MTTYNLLPYDSWHRLTDLMPEDQIPPIESSLAAVAENEEGELVGVLFPQMTLHMEPLYLKNPNVNFLRLQHIVEEALKDPNRLGSLQYFTFTEDGKTARMAEKGGMTLIPCQIYKKEI